MTDGLTPTNSSSSGNLIRRNGYQSNAAREIRARASTVDQGSSIEERRGLRRLNHVLDRDQPARANVPRGFYLNIEV